MLLFVVTLLTLSFSFFFLSDCSDFCASHGRVLFVGDSPLHYGSMLPEGFLNRLQSYTTSLCNSEKIFVESAFHLTPDDVLLKFDSLILPRSPSHLVLMMGVDEVMGGEFGLHGWTSHMRAVVNKAVFHNISVVLCTPTVIGEKVIVPNEYDEMLEELSGGLIDIADVFNMEIPERARVAVTPVKVRIVDLHAALVKYLEVLNTEDLSYSTITFDGIHFNTIGHHFMLKCLCHAFSLPMPDVLRAPDNHGTKHSRARHLHEEKHGNSHVLVAFDL